MDDFDHLMAKAEEVGVKILLDFVPNHTSDQHEWFGKSVNGEEPYKDYYIWQPGKVDPSNATVKLPPCNWQAISYGLGTAWTWNEKRQAFYYHQFSDKQPDLNFRNEKVQEEMEKVMKFWLDKKISGFRVDAVTHIYEDSRLLDEPIADGTSITDPTDYGYLKHIYTADQNETFDLIYKWRKFLDDYSSSNGVDTKILMTESYSSIDTVQRYYTNGTVEGAHLPFNFELMKQLRATSKAQDVVNAVHSWLITMPAQHYTNWVVLIYLTTLVTKHFIHRFTCRLVTMTVPDFHQDSDASESICSMHSSYCCPELQ